MSGAVTPARKGHPTLIGGSWRITCFTACAYYFWRALSASKGIFVIALIAAFFSLEKRPQTKRLSIGGFQLLARNVWRRGKGGYIRRAVRRLLIAIYRLAGRPVLPNSCCTGALMSAAGSCASSIPLPP